MIVILIILSLFTTQLIADGVQPEGTGTESDPYRIATLDNLLWMSTNSDGLALGTYIIQTADIDASETADWNDGEGFSPIGTTGPPFRGCYDGLGHTIEHLTILRPGVDNQALFGMILGGTVENLSVLQVNVSGNGSVGGIAGRIMYNAAISNCTCSGSVCGQSSVGGIAGECLYNVTLTSCNNAAEVTGGTYDVGGIAGDLTYSSAMMLCQNSGTVTGSADYMGGLVGTLSRSAIGFSSSMCDVSSTGNHIGGLVGRAAYESSVTDCHCTGDVLDGTHYMGGVIGSSHYTSVVECSSTGNVSGTFEAGGLVGDIFGGTFERCWCTGNVSGVNIVGGFLGCADGGDVVDCYSHGNVLGTTHVGGLAGHCSGISIDRCYSMGGVSGETYYGGLVGLDNYHESTITCSFWDTQASGQSASDGGTGLTTAQMQTLATYLNAGWDFIDETANGTDDIWGLNWQENDGYPFLAWQEYNHDPNQAVHDYGVASPVPSCSLFPNPFNPTTQVRFSLAQPGQAELSVYNARGQRVTTLVNGPLPAGSQTVRWNGTDDAGRAVGTGLYFFRLRAAGVNQVCKGLLLK